MWRGFGFIVLLPLIVFYTVSPSIVVYSSGVSKGTREPSGYFVLVNRSEIMYGSINLINVDYASSIALFNVSFTVNGCDRCIVYWIQPRVQNVEVIGSGEKIPYIRFEALVFKTVDSIHSRRLSRVFNVSIPDPRNYTVGLFVNGIEVYWIDSVFINVSSHREIQPVYFIKDPSEIHLIHYTPGYHDVEVGPVEADLVDDKLIIRVNVTTSGPCGIIFGKLGESPESDVDISTEYYGLDGKPQPVYIDRGNMEVEIHYIYFIDAFHCLASITRMHEYRIPLKELDSYGGWRINIYVDGHNEAGRTVIIQAANTTTTTGSTTEKTTNKPGRNTWINTYYITASIAIIAVLAVVIYRLLKQKHKPSSTISP